MTSLGRTSQDLTIEANVIDARAELFRAGGDADFAAWARRWGDQAILAIEWFMERHGGWEGDF